MYAAPEIIHTEVFAQLPEQFRMKGNRRSFLEGPSFDRSGNLFVTNIPHGRVFRILPTGSFELVAEYDGEPNGLKVHRDGRVFIADHKHGIVVLDPATGATKVILDRPRRERFKGLNDLVFNSRGDLYFTDQGESGLQDATGRLWVLQASGNLELILDNVPSPNGLVLSPDERILFLAATRANAIWRVPLNRNDRPGRVGLFIQLSGAYYSYTSGGGGPDGLAIDDEGQLAIAHPGNGCVWLFDRRGRPVSEIRSCAGEQPTNVAYGGPDNRTLFIVESETGSILTARLNTPGRRMFSHADV